MPTSEHPLLNNPLKNIEGENLMGNMQATTHPEDVLVWRNDEFSRMGFSQTMATFLSETHIDLHEMAKLITGGCDRTVAVDILLGTNFLGDDPYWIWGSDESS